MLDVPVTKLNYRYLPQIIKKLIEEGDKAVILNIIDDPAFSVSYQKLQPYIYTVLELEEYIDIQIKNIPACQLENAEDHILPEAKKQYAPGCSNCFKKTMCNGVSTQHLETHGTQELKPIKDKPREVIVEVTSKCNFDCHFCFNKNSHASDGIRTLSGLSTQHIKNIIDQTVRHNIKIIRFSGGEPLLRQDITALCAYAKQQDREVRINTNGTLLTKNFLEKTEQYIDNILIALNAQDAISHSSLTKVPGSFDLVIKGMRQAKASSIPIVRSGTCMTQQNINHFEELHNLLINQLELDDWEFYRSVAYPGNPEPTTKQEIAQLIQKIIDLKGRDKPYFIVNSLPYCILGKDKRAMKKVRAVSVGARYDDGHTRFVIDPKGDAFPSYYLTKKVGTHQDIMAAWKHPFMKALHENKSIPEECKGCSMLYNCKGGSRFHAHLAYGKYDAPDPLMHDAPAFSPLKKIKLLS